MPSLLRVVWALLFSLSGFAALAQTPTIGSFSPTSGPAGTTVTVTGTNLTNIRSVVLRGIPCNITAISSTQASFKVPAQASTGRFRLTTTGGNVLSASDYTVTRASNSLTYVLRTSTFNSINVGAFSTPAFTDLDHDGLIDLLVGREVDGFVSHYEQSSANSTSFTLRSNNLSGLTGHYNSLVSVTDIDGDGLLELVVGTGAGNFKHYEQTAMNGTSFTQLSNDFNNVFSAGGLTFQIPHFTDIDGDGLLDLLVGDEFLSRYEQTAANGGTFTQLNNQNFGPTADALNGGSSTCVVDLDGDGLLDMLVGRTNGQMFHYEQNSANSTSFTQVTATFNGLDVGSYSAPSFTDLDGDGLLDMLVGGSDGALRHYEQVGTPTITSFTPTSGVIGTSVTVTGTNLDGATAARVNGTAGTITGTPTSTSLTFTVGAGSTTGAVTVITPGGTATGSTFTVTAPAPTITSFNPTSGGVGTSVTITGTNLNGATAARVNGTNGTIVGTPTSTSLTFTVGVGSTTGAVSVVTPGGTATGSTFTVTTPPTITSFNPTSGPVGTSVTITGTNLTGAILARVNFAVGTITANTATSLTFTVGASSTTGAVSVTTTGGTATGATFTVISAPTITNFTPTSGPAGTSVTITGTNLAGVTGVRFGTGTLTTNFVSQSATSLTVRVPVVSSTGVITLTSNTGATVSTATNFTYTPRPAGLTATLSPAGPLDVCAARTLTATASSPAFATGTGFNGAVQSVVVQADGKVLVGGNFLSYNGTTGVNGLVRLNADGTRDATFVTGTGFNGNVLSVAVQADGRVLVGGTFTSYNGTTGLNRLVRLNADGTRDASFVTGTGFDNQVFSVAVQADGRVLVGGDFTSYDGTTGLNRLVRLNADGTRDTGFATGTGFDVSVRSVAVQADGKVLVVGAFTSYNGTAGVNRLVRLNADGTRDTGFATGTGFPSTGQTVLSVAVQTDGRVLVGGQFTNYNGTTGVNRLVRLNADGTSDASFATGTGFDGTIRSLAVQTDGRVLAGGDFASYNGTTGLNRLIRLNADGTRDATLATGTGFSSVGEIVQSVAVQADGQVLAGGNFTIYNGTTGQNRLVRLSATGGLNTTATAVTGATFTFSPGGTTTNPLVTSTAGTYTAVASLNGETSAASNAVTLTACPPSITNFTPTSGPVGTSVTITGTNLTGATGVAVNGTAGTSLTGNTATSLTFTVGAGTTTGNVSVTTPGGTATGSTFTVTVPTVTSVSAPANDTYGISDNLNFSVVFNQQVTVNTGGGTPTLLLTVGSTVVAATYLSGSNTTTLTFRYTVGAGDLDTDGVALGGSISLNGGTIRNAGGDNALLTLNGVPSTAGVLVDGAAPTVVITSTAGPSGSTTGVSPIVVTITFSEPVTSFTNADVSVSNGNRSGFATVNSSTYTVNITPTGTPPVLVTINVAANAARDLATNNSLAATAYTFTYTPGPSITSFNPTSGPVGTSIVVTGTNLTGATAARVNGTAGTITANSATSLTFTVGAGSTTGAVSVTTPGGTATGSTFTVTNAPTALALTPQSVAENTGANAVVGTFSTTDPDVGNTFTYTLVTGAGSGDNALVNISGNSLRITASPNFEAKPTYAIRVRTTDNTSLFTEQAFTISVTDVNEAPTALALAPQNVDENTGANAVVGTLSTTDPDAANTFTYTLVAGTGSGDNGLVNISGNTLRITASPDFETQPSYAVRVRTTDQNGLFTEQAFTISVNDLAEGPGISSFAPALGPEGTVVTLIGADFSGTTGVSFNGTAAAGFTVVSGTQLTATVPVGATSGLITVTTNTGSDQTATSFEVLSIYTGTFNSCLSTTSISSTGSSQWQYLRAGNGQLVAALNDQGHALGTVSIDFYLNQGAIRSDAEGREYFDRNWKITAQNTFAGQQVRVRLYARNTEFAAYQAANDADGNDVTNRSQLRLTQYSGPNEDCLLSNNNWTSADTRLLTPAAVEALSGANWFGLETLVEDHFSEFLVNGGIDPLPVELVRFEAKRQATQAVGLTWTTASEKANRGFVIERSADGRTFTAVSELLAGRGTTSTANTYVWTDRQAPATLLYYRLRQLDTDGTATYSGVVSVRATEAAVALQAWPNPARETLTLQPPTGAQSVEILDALGRVVLTVPTPTAAPITLRPALPTGIYTVRAGAETVRLVVE